jgi:IclR family transcriptional regulator, mhp operon transcriptional activator
MPSFPPVQSVQRALALLTELNRQRVASVGELHRRTGLPKPTIVRLLETLIAEGFAASDSRLGGYQVTSKVAALNSGFHGAPMVIEAARPWAIDLTRKLKWPAAVAVLQENAVFVRFSTRPCENIFPPPKTARNQERSTSTRAFEHIFAVASLESTRAQLGPR